MIHFTGTLSSRGSLFNAQCSCANFYLKSPLAQMHECSLNWLQFKTTTDTELDSSRPCIQLHSCKQQMLPRKFRIIFQFGANFLLSKGLKSQRDG